MIIGAGEAGRMLAVEYAHSNKTNVRVCCFIDDNAGKKSRRLEGLPIVGAEIKLSKPLRI